VRQRVLGSTESTLKQARANWTARPLRRGTGSIAIRVDHNQHDPLAMEPPPLQGGRAGPARSYLQAGQPLLATVRGSLPAWAAPLTAKAGLAE
jgi:hypothetical protein